MHVFFFQNFLPIRRLLLKQLINLTVSNGKKIVRLHAYNHDKFHATHDGVSTLSIEYI